MVAFPTETVYRLGANALNAEAVKKIFIAKGRPPDNPLIVYIANKNQLNEIAKIQNLEKRLVEKLIQEFWPGPLTIILKKTEKIPLEVTAGLNTVAIRMPKNKIALKLISYSGVPIAAPSANLSGKPSGTCFEHVFDDFNGKIAGIIKSKSSELGLESTVIDLTKKKPILLRPGAISYEELKNVLSDLRLHVHKNPKNAKSPGMNYKHYSPDAKIILFKKSAFDNLDSVIKKFNYILISSVDESGVGMALMHRIRKAAFKIIG